MSGPAIEVMVLPGRDPDLPLPRYATDGAAGMDLAAALPGPDRAAIVLAPLSRVAVPTGLALAIPPGFEGQVRPRSGTARDLGLTVLNAPGTLDADYRGEVLVLLVNLGDRPVRIEHGMRIAQLVIAPVARATLVPVATLPATARGAGSFGSTGVQP